MYEDFFARIKRDYQLIRALPTDKERLQFIARIVNWSTVPDSNDICLIRNSLLRAVKLGIKAYSCDHRLNREVLEPIYEIALVE